MVMRTTEWDGFAILASRRTTVLSNRPAQETRRQWHVPTVSQRSCRGVLQRGMRWKDLRHAGLAAKAGSVVCDDDLDRVPFHSVSPRCLFYLCTGASFLCAFVVFCFFDCAPVPFFF